MEAERDKLDLARMFQADVDKMKGLGFFVGGAAAGSVLGPIGAIVGAVFGAHVGSKVAPPGIAFLQKLLGIKYHSDGLCEAIVAVMLTESQSAAADYIKKGTLETFRDQMQALIEIDQRLTKTVNDEIMIVKPATRVTKKAVPQSVTRKFKVDLLLTKFSPIDEHFTGLEEIEMVDIDLSTVDGFMPIREKLQRGLKQGKELLTKLQTAP